METNCGPGRVKVISGTPPPIMCTIKSHPPLQADQEYYIYKKGDSNRYRVAKFKVVNESANQLKITLENVDPSDSGDYNIYPYAADASGTFYLEVLEGKTIIILELYNGTLVRPWLIGLPSSTAPWLD